MRSPIRLFPIGATLLLVACGGGSSNPVPTVSLTAASTAVSSGGSPTLTWSSTNASSCTASGGWSGSLATSGSKSTGSLTAATTFSLTCTGAGGTSRPASVAVNIVPTATLAASPPAVSQNGTSTLTWSSTNATSCMASGGWSGSLASSGSKSSGALTKTTTFSLTCAGPGGTSAAATTTVTVSATTLTASPTVVAPNGVATLTWSSPSSASCTASGAWSGPLPNMGTQSTGPLTATTNTYTLTCGSPGAATTTASATVTVSSTAMSLTPSIAAITLTSKQQFTATVPGGGAATWMVDGVPGGSSTVGQVSLTGLYTAGTVPGLHTVTATSVANVTQTADASVAVTDLAGVYTYHNDLARDGVNIQEYALTTAIVGGHFGKRASCAVDGAIYAQPLWVANLTVQGAKHNVVFVATQHDGLFAFDADASPCK